MRVSETFNVKVNDKVTFEVLNEGTKLFNDMAPQAKTDLEDFLKEQAEAGKMEGFLPYNNFESSIRWKIK